MENKLQQLTEKLYNDGLSKGRAEAEQMLATAKKQEAEIIAEANRQADNIIAKAKRDAEQLKTNTENEIRLAAGQMQSSLRQQIERIVAMQTVTQKVTEAWKDTDFIKNLAMKAIEQYKGEATVILPQTAGQELIEAVRSAAGEKFGKGVEVVTDGKIKVPFRIAPKGEGYYVSFTDADFDTLFQSYMRPKVSELLFGKDQKR